MDDIQVGSVIRAIRIRRGLRQSDVAAAAGVSKSTVSLVERGYLGGAGVGTVRRIAAALEIALTFAPRWRGTHLARLLDQRHAALVGQTAAELRRRGWEARPELTFNQWGERGSVDLLGLLPARRAALVIECKTAIIDLQDLLSTLDRKRRLAPTIVEQEYGWRPAALGCVLVVADSSTTRGEVARHEPLFQATLAGRTVGVRRWMANPVHTMGGIWFVRCSGGSGRRQQVEGLKRVGRAPARGYRGERDR
jgi:transcriptional regulator with XRE-family HTH domain